MKKIITTLSSMALCCSMALINTACSNSHATDFIQDAVNGNISSAQAKSVTKNYTFGTLKGLSASTGIEVYYTASASGKTQVKAVISQKLAPYFEADMNGGTLKLSFSKNISVQNEEVKVYITGAAPQSVSLSSGADLHMQNDLKIDGNFSINLSSGADAEINGISCTSLSANLSSGADIDFDRISCTDFRLTNSSGADADIDRIKANTITVSASSGADATLKGINCKQIKASASSGADCKLEGKCSGTAILSASSAANISAQDLSAATFHINKNSEGDISYNKSAKVVKTNKKKKTTINTGHDSDIRFGSDTSAM